MTNFDRVINRVCNLLFYEDPSAVIKKLVWEGLDEEEAYLIVKAARILNLDRRGLQDD